MIEPNSHEAVAAAIIELLDDRAALLAIQHLAYETGRTTIWPEFARAGAALVRSAIAETAHDIPLSATPGLSAVHDISDGTGILQHAIGVVPDCNHGYCLDDNARALMLMNVTTGLIC